MFTVNNPNGQLLPETWPQRQLKYVIWSEELGSLDEENASGQHHFQGYLELKMQVSITTLKTWPGLEPAHFAPRRGSQQQAIAYCSKKDDPTFLDGPWQYGEKSKQGQRSDLIELQSDLNSGHTLSYIARNHFSNFIRYNKGITEYLRVTKPIIEAHEYTINDFNRPALNLDKAVVLLGPTKLGKTEFALAHFNFPLLVRHIDSLRNLQPGEHDGIVFDDMKFGHFPTGARIALLDINHTSEIHCRYSNGIIPAKFRRIFTTNNPDIFFNPNDTSDERDAISRRVQFINVDVPLFGTADTHTIAPPSPGATRSTSVTIHPANGPSRTYANYEDYLSRNNQSLVDLYQEYASSPSPTTPPRVSGVVDLYSDEHLTQLL